MKSRKTNRKQQNRRRNRHLGTKHLALTTICVTTMPIVLLAAATTPVDQTLTGYKETPAKEQDLYVAATIEAEQRQPDETSNFLSEEGNKAHTHPDVQEEDTGTAASPTAITVSQLQKNSTEKKMQRTTTKGKAILLDEENRQTRFTNPQAFIQQVAPMAQQIAAIHDLYASIMIAQAILESGWGQSILTKQANNLFGIKGNYNGQFVEMTTLEDDGSGHLYEVIDRFRRYPSLEESLQDNARVLRTTSFTPGGYFYAGAWSSNTQSYRQAAYWLQGRYATDTRYAQKLIQLIESYQLNQYDSGTNNQITTIDQQFQTTAGLNIRDDASTSASIIGSLARHTRFQGVASKTGTNVNGHTTWYRLNGGGWVSGAYLQAVANNTIHTVKSGDTLWDIAQMYGVSVNQLMTWNSLQQSLILVRQQLVVART